MRSPACITIEFDGYDDLEEKDRNKLNNALWTGEWSDSFVNTINAVHQRTRKRFELTERISRWSQQQLLDPSNETILRWLLTQSCNKAGPCLSDNEVERLYSIEPTHAPSVIIHSKGSIHYVPSSVLSFIFSFLEPCKDLLGKCIRVSRNWLNIVPISTSCTHWEDSERHQPLDRVDRVAPNWISNIQHLSLAMSYLCEQWRARLGSCQRLTSLSLENAADAIWADISRCHFSKPIPLKRLSIKGTSASFDPSLLNHRSLTHCSILNIGFVWRPITGLVTSQLQLLELTVAPNGRPREGTVDIIDLANARSLHTLSLVGQWIITNSDGASSSLRDVEYSFVVPGYDLSGEATLKQKEKATSSILLTLSKWFNVTRVKLAGIPIVSLPSSIQSWRHVNLSGVEKV
jgi:hypothetical protein